MKSQNDFVLGAILRDNEFSDSGGIEIVNRQIVHLKHDLSAGRQTRLRPDPSPLPAARRP